MCRLGSWTIACQPRAVLAPNNCQGQSECDDQALAEAEACLDIHFSSLRLDC